MLSTINDSGSEGANKTSIMYNFYLSCAQLKEYLSFLLEKGPIVEFPQQLRLAMVMKNLYTEQQKKDFASCRFLKKSRV
jgi:Winged helix-turn-helix